jgi:hypothetical protein
MGINFIFSNFQQEEMVVEAESLSSRLVEAQKVHKSFAGMIQKFLDSKSAKKWKGKQLLIQELGSR